MLATEKTDCRGVAVRVLSICIVVLGLVACDSRPESGALSPPLPLAQFERIGDPEVINSGAQLYQQHCAGCHGARAEGDPAWRRPGADGRYPPPPLDGSGHAWHHSRAWLKAMIRDGSQPEGNMPAWGALLSEDEIEAVVAWFQSLWSEQVYGAWREMQRRSL